MSYKKLNKLMQKVDIGLAPLFPNKNAFSSGKSFGKILAYLNNEVIVFASDCLEHSKFFDDENGFLWSDEINDWCLKLENIINNDKKQAKIVEKAKKGYPVMI